MFIIYLTYEKKVVKVAFILVTPKEEIIICFKK